MQTVRIVVSKRRNVAFNYQRFKALAGKHEDE